MSKKIHSLIYIYLLFWFCDSQIQKYPCSKTLTIDISNGNKLDDGLIQHENITFNRHHYFFDKEKILGCICNIKKCIRKCCNTDEIYSSNICIDRKDEIFNFTFFNGIEPSNDNINDFVIIFGSQCPGRHYYLITPDSSDDIFLQENGSLINKAWENIYSVDKYCVDLFNNEMSALICESDEFEEDAVKLKINGSGEYFIKLF